MSLLSTIFYLIFQLTVISTMSTNVTLTPLICFIVCDSGPAGHFAAFVTSLFLQYQLRSNIYATGPALTKLNSSYLPDGIQLFPFTIDDSDIEQQENVAKELIDNCIQQGARTIIVDIANQFDVVLQRVSSKQNLIRSWSYYDNPEAYVPGGYSTKTEETIKASKYILFANMNLVKPNSNIYSLPNKTIDLSDKIVQGTGYYPVTDAEKLLQQRQIEKDTLRTMNNWSNIKYLFVYFGGNNDVYFDQALPSFLANLAQVDQNLVEDILFLFHQHPAAKKQNRDGLLIQEWMRKNNHIQAMISTLNTSDQAQSVADAALYYQTSMAPLFVLLGLPTMQVGHEVYNDVLVKYKLCYTATNPTELAVGLKALKEKRQSADNVPQDKQLIYDAIGYTPDWPKNLLRIVLDY